MIGSGIPINHSKPPLSMGASPHLRQLIGRCRSTQKTVEGRELFRTRIFHKLRMAYDVVRDDLPVRIADEAKRQACR